MSRTPLFDHLVDDAAVFPPGLAPLDVAVRVHLDRRTQPYAGHVGPLLVPATDAPELARLAAADERSATQPLAVGLVVRPGADGDALRASVDRLREDPRVVVTGVELGWSSGWRSVLSLDVPVAVEVGLGRDQQAALDDVADAVDGDADVVAKFRTGATPTWPWPDEQVLAGFLDAVVLHGLAFKLTGGLHHAVRGAYGPDQMHGLLNIIVAVHEALDGAETPQIAHLLAQTSAELLAERVSRLTAVEAARVRGSFTAYGCCGVLDPLVELAALGLIDEHPHLDR
jgi:hypothetical protein